MRPNEFIFNIFISLFSFDAVFVETEWFIAVVARFSKPTEKSANHSKWYATTNCGAKIEHSNGNTDSR